MESGSPHTISLSSGICTSTSSFRPVILVSRLMSTWLTTSVRSNCSWAVTVSSARAFSRDRSSIRRTRRDSRRVSDTMIWRDSRSRSGGMVPSRMPSAKPEMVVMGVFSSWDTLAMNSDRWLSTLAREFAMVLKDSARVLISSHRPS